MAHSATGVVRLAAIPLRIWLFRDRSNHPRRSLWPRLPLLIQSRGEGNRSFNSFTAPGRGSGVIKQ